MSKAAIHKALSAFHEAQTAHDLDGIVEFYGDHGFVDKPSMRHYFESLIEQDAFRDRHVDLSNAETFIFKDKALVRPVVYETTRGRRSFSFQFEQASSGAWKIIDNRRSYLPGDSLYDLDIVSNPAKVVGSRGMLWSRRLNVPAEQVWQAISTVDGLNQWWITQNVKLDLRPGGLFTHHWTNRIVDFRPLEFIAFEGDPADSGAKQYMRFDLEHDSEATIFHFFDAFHAYNNPLTIAWTISGWHGTVDALETMLTGRKVYDFGLGGEFYFRYLRNHHRFLKMAGELPDDAVTAEDWQEAYLVDAV